MSENPANKEDGKLIDLGKSFSNPILKLSSPIVEKLFDVDNFNDFYTRTCRMPQELNFFDRALHVTSIDYVISTEDRERIPTQGPVIVVSNHPHGIADGLILGSLLLSVRCDVKFIVNYLLGAMKELDPYFIQVNPFGGNNATKANTNPIKEVFKYIKQGGCIGTFPSGTVSHLFLSKRRVTDPVWNENIAAIARKTRATVVPIFIGGRNSNLFQAAGLIHPRLRTALLLREVVASAGQTIELRVGQPIPPTRLDKFETNAEVIDYLRLKTYILGNRTEPEKRLHFIRMPSLTRQKKLIDPLAQPIPPEALEAEIKTLPKDALLVSHGDMQVYLTDYASIPTIIQEIGRLREKTFRAVGEGTGKSLDIDEYDPHYLHLFMWNPKAREIVGGYRLGRTDKILEEFGPKGIYTSSLFHFKDQLLERISPALEMGRSYIREEYQRKPNALPLLWRGIGEYVSRNQQYRVLFGPVSISSDYKAFSRDLMVQYLKNNTLDVNLHGYVKARRPPRSGNKMQQVDKKSLNASVRDIEDISELISDIETDRKGVPVLIRHYLKLNATILSFNVDKDFCNVIDGLIMVDLMRTDLKILRRFMGDDAVEQFTARHASAPQISEAPVPAGR
jgi:putative hemolysin